VKIVVDASVAIKWLLPEPDSALAEQVALSDASLIAPGLVIAEACNVVWKRLRRGEVRAEQAEIVAARLPEFFDALMTDAPLAPLAMRIARLLDHPVYDCFYLALAEREDARMVTADRHLIGRVRATAWESRAIALESFSFGA
jgi:predicted nucleic acid-binding protein